MNSIAQQSYEDYEVIMVDDGLRDSSVTICNELEKGDTRFHYYSGDGGVNSARNLGLKYARGGYICFVDADDKLAPDYFLHFLELSSDGSLGVRIFTRNISELDEINR